MNKKIKSKCNDIAWKTFILSLIGLGLIAIALLVYAFWMMMTIDIHWFLKLLIILVTCLGLSGAWVMMMEND